MNFKQAYEKYLQYFIFFVKIELGDYRGNRKQCTLILYTINKTRRLANSSKKGLKLLVLHHCGISEIQHGNMYPFVSGEFTPSEYHANAEMRIR